MSDDKPVRVALGFHAGGALSLRLAPSVQAALEERLRAGAEGFERIDTEDGPALVNLAQVIYLRPESSESRVGF